MNKWLVNTSDTDEKQMCEVNKNLMITSGLDKVKFVNPSLGVAGDAGMNLNKDYWDAPVLNSEGTGTLDETKFYSIILQPVSTYLANPNTGEFMSGALTHYSDPVQPSVASKSLLFDMPDLSEQQLVFTAGVSTGGTPTEVQDLTRTWTDDTWIGYTVTNVETGLTALCTANTDTILTIDTDIGLIGGEGYHISKTQVTGYVIYGAELNSAEEILLGAYTLQGTISTDSSQFELATFVSGGLVALDSNFPPDPYYACVSADNKMIAGGGMQYEEGEMWVDVTESSATNSIAISLTFANATVPGTGGELDRIMRYTMSAAQTTMRRGSIVTITGAEDSANDIVDASIQRMAPDGTWFEIIQPGGVVNADDDTASIAFVRNVLTGNTSGENITHMSESMVGSSFKFNSDIDPYYITWVDVVTQEAGISAKYVGLTSGTISLDPRPVNWVSAWSNAEDKKASATGGVFDTSGANGFSTAGWFMAGAPSQFKDFIRIGCGGTDRLELRLDRDRRGFEIRSIRTDGSSYNDYYTSPELLVGDTWYHLAWTQDPGQNKTELYINGVAADRYGNAPTLVTAFDQNQSNTYFELRSSWLGFSFAKWSVYDRSLSQAEALVDMNGGIKSGVLEFYPMDDGSGMTVAPTVGATPMTWDGDQSEFLWTSDHEYGVPVELPDTSGFLIYSDFGLAWSDAGWPHIFRTENYTPISDRIMALAAFNQTLILFCENSVQAVPLTGLGQTPYLLSDDVQCRAPHSIVSTPSGVFFYDGSGISMTDGQQIIPVTAYRASDYLGYINQSRVVNIRGVYDPEHRRAEFFFPYGDGENNDYGLTISTDSLNCYPSQRLDVNAAWTDRADTGELIVRHGTTDQTGAGSIWSHDASLGTDTGITQELVGNITAVNSRILTVDFGEDLDVDSVVNPGDPCMFLPDGTGSYFQFKVLQLIASNPYSLGSYELTVDDDADISAFNVDDSVIIGGIPFDYGIKWTDFTSPQYKHNVRQLHIDVTNFNGILFVEHYRDMLDTSPTNVTSHYVNAETTKIASDNNAGDCYTYGFRVYGVSMTKFEFHSFEILFETEQ